MQCRQHVIVAATVRKATICWISVTWSWLRASSTIPKEYSTHLSACSHCRTNQVRMQSILDDTKCCYGACGFSGAYTPVITDQTAFVLQALSEISLSLLFDEQDKGAVGGQPKQAAHAQSRERSSLDSRSIYLLTNNCSLRMQWDSCCFGLILEWIGFHHNLPLHAGVLLDAIRSTSMQHLLTLPACSKSRFL